MDMEMSNVNIADPSKGKSKVRFASPDSQALYAKEYTTGKAWGYAKLKPKKSKSDECYSLLQSYVNETLEQEAGALTIIVRIKIKTSWVGGKRLIEKREKFTVWEEFSNYAFLSHRYGEARRRALWRKLVMGR